MHFVKADPHCYNIDRSADDPHVWGTWSSAPRKHELLGCIYKSNGQTKLNQTINNLWLVTLFSVHMPGVRCPKGSKNFPSIKSIRNGIDPNRAGCGLTSHCSRHLICHKTSSFTHTCAFQPLQAQETFHVLLLHPRPCDGPKTGYASFNVKLCHVHEPGRGCRQPKANLSKVRLILMFPDRTGSGKVHIRTHEKHVHALSI